MSDQPQKRSSPDSKALAVIVLPVLYVLSSGPVFWLLMMSLGYVGTARTVFDVVYYPLGWLNDNVEFVRKFFDWYMPVWYP